MNVRTALPILTLTLTLACASPSQPTEPVVVRFDDPSGVLAGKRTMIDSLAVATIARVTAALGLTGVTVTVIPDGSRAIGGYGLGGYTPDERTVNVYLDAAFPGLDTLLSPRFPPLLAHELHHAMRWRAPGYGNTLFTAMISEGLADRFAHELLGAPLPPWSEAFPESQTEHYLDLARPEFDSRSYNHPRWFFEADPSLPRWTGYTLGYRLVAAYIASHPGTNATNLTSQNADVFRP